MTRTSNRARRTREVREVEWNSSTPDSTVLNNANFEAYYKAQNLLKEDEWEAFMSSLQTPLPTTFRLTGTRQQAIEILDTIEKIHVPSLTGIKIDEEAIEPPKPISWYPNRFGWHISAPRSLIKKSTEFTKFRKFLVAETEVGNISRQEAVSMIPPLVLDVQPHHLVLDMCAAPGSKTAQLIEDLHKDLGTESESKLQSPEGIILANDSVLKRCYTLIHQIKRLKSPNFVVTNHEAQFFPNIRLSPETSSDKKYLQFDRILCDVPCSGDGTLRKNFLIWKDWHVGQGLGLHNLQSSILARGIQLLKVGGRLVYSTCSMNPIENEAVVASVLNLYPGKITLRDASHLLPELKRKPGVSSWKVFIKKDEEAESFEALSKEDKAKKWATPTLFPPQNSASLGLEKCMRIYPHLQNTGGFFIAIFEKTEAISGNELKANHMESACTSESVNPPEGAISKVCEGVTDSVDEVANPLIRPATEELSGPDNKRHCFKEEPFVFLTKDSPELENIKTYFGLEGFPTDQLLVRSTSDHNKTVSFVSESVMRVLNSPDVNRLKVINTGVKAFCRIGSPGKHSCTFRLQCESLSIIIPFLPPSMLVAISPMDMNILLKQQNPLINDLSPMAQEILTPLDEGGSFVVTFDMKKFSENQTSSAEEEAKILISPESAGKLTFPLWKAGVSVNLLVNKQEKSSLLMRLFGDHL